MEIGKGNNILMSIKIYIMYILIQISRWSEKHKKIKKYKMNNNNTNIKHEFKVTYQGD
jgi:hypothetical protein